MRAIPIHDSRSNLAGHSSPDFCVQPFAYKFIPECVRWTHLVAKAD